MKQKQSLKLDMLETVKVCIRLMYLYVFLISAKSILISIRTAARRQTETVAESVARHARNSQGLCMLDVSARVFNFYLNLI